MKYRNKTVYTFGELVKMGINANTLNQAFYGRDVKKLGVKSGVMLIPRKVKYISEDSFNRYLKALIKKKPVVK